MRIPSATGLLIVLVLGTTAAFGAQAERIDISQRGPSVGEAIPEFTLRDQNGETWTQDSILGPDGAMLVFVRSADW